MKVLKEKFIIIDGSSLMYRAFYALPLLETKKGQYTNAVYGFATMLFKLLENFSPEYIVVAFDKGKITFRNEIFDQYKAHRKETPSELSMQIPLIHEFLVAMNITLIEESGFEADDIIGTLANKAAANNKKVLIVTGDKDALQLINDDISVLLTKKGISEMLEFDKKLFKETYGLECNQLIDLKALMGDSSDNIPGVPGVGEKTATKLLAEYNTLQNIYENIDNVSGKKLQEKLKDNKDLAFISQQLAKINNNVPLNYAEEQYKLNLAENKLEEFCLKYEFKSILARANFLESKSPEQIAITPVEFCNINNSDEFKILVDKIIQEKKMVFYPVLESSAFDLKHIFIANSNQSYYISNNSEIENIFVTLLENPEVEKITYDVKKLYKFCFQQHKMIQGTVFDIMLAAYLLEPMANNYSIESLHNFYVGENYHLNEKNIEIIQLQAFYVETIEKIYQSLKSKLKQADLFELYQTVEMPLIKVLAKMELYGIKVDAEQLKIMSAEMDIKIKQLLEDIYEMAAEPFNVNSPKQLGVILFEKLNLPIIKKNKTGYSTDAEVLEQLRDQHQIISKILEYRLLTKLKSTYLEGLGNLLSPTEMRIHTSFNQMVTATGRLSSSEPNLQNIPTRSEEGKKIRALFVPGLGFDYLLSADYSQIELRILAHMANDPNLISAFNDNQDVHARTAAEVFSVDLSAVTPEMRSRAKAVNFGIVYGISDYGLAKDINVSRKEAGEYISNYFSKYPGVKNFIDNIIADAKKNGYVITMFGRRRYLKDINSSNYNIRSFAERMAMNTPIQGTAADIIKLAMIKVDYDLQKNNLKSRILLQVHDELLLEVVEAEVEIVSEIVTTAMQNVVSLAVPLTVDVKVGKSWAETK